MVEMIEAIHVTEAVEEEEDEENEDIIEADIVTSSSGHLNVTPVEQSRSRSPVTVQEWVAALPPLESHSDDDHGEDQHGDTDEDEDKHEPSDHIRLGEEASYFVPEGVKNFGQLLLQKNNKNIRSSLQHSDTMTSLKSDATNSSMDSVLQSREADPEEVLYNLGFADSEALAKIPRRFFQKPSVARGVSIENFKRQQEEMFGRYESGFFGYRGLQGGLHRRPSELVDKILKTLRDREIHRANSIISNGCHSIPARFKVMDPNRSTFDSVVRRVAEKERLKVNSFKSLARSVLSKENRIWRQEQIKEKNNTKAKQLLVIGGKSFIVDDEGNEEEIKDPPTFSKNNSKHSMHSEESGFNEDEVEASEAGESEVSSDKSHLLFSREPGDRSSFTEYCDPVNTSRDKSAN